MNTLKSLIFNNFKIKFLSLLFAISIWFYCMNVTADMEITTSFNISLNVLNAEAFEKEDMLLQNKTKLQQTSIRLRVKGKRVDIENLQRSRELQERFTAYIDLGLIELKYAKQLSTPTPTTVFLTKAPGYEVMEQYPTTVDVILEKYTNQTRDITVYTEGKPAEGYTDLAKEIKLEKVTISGPQTPVSKVSEVRVVVNVKGATKELVVDAIPKAYDFEGNEIEDITITPSTIKVTVPIYKLAKIPISKPDYKGEPPDGYEITGIDWNPKYAEIMGKEEDIANMREITLLPLDDVSNLTETTTVPYDLRSYLTTNIQIINGTAQEINVEIYIEKLEQKTLIIPSNKIEINGNADTVVFQDTSVSLTVSGTANVMQDIDNSSVTASVDLTGLLPGEYDLPLTLTLPDNINPLGDTPTIKTTILARD